MPRILQWGFAHIPIKIDRNYSGGRDFVFEIFVTGR